MNRGLLFGIALIVAIALPLAIAPVFPVLTMCEMEQLYP